MKALILQMRGNGDKSRDSEQNQYLTFTGLQAHQIDFIDLYDEPDIDPAIMLDYDALMVGGISRDIRDELTWPKERFPFIDNMRALLRLAIDHKVPALLSCGGFVIAGDMLGAETHCRLKNFELGVVRMVKTEAAQKDLFLGPVSDRLAIISGHVKYFKEVPPNTELLMYTNSYTDRVPVHVFKVKNAPFYAFQGHPEIPCEEVAKRIEPLLYRKHYFPPREGQPEDEKHGYNLSAYQAFCRIDNDTSEAQGLLSRFINLVKEGAFLKSS
jgi:GMP synthase (glutamine-hydrolysing)